MFAKSPQWFIDNVELDVKPTITYLGTVLGDMNGNAHCEARSRAAHKSFYALQGAGIIFPGVPVSPEASIKMYDMAVRSVLTYGCTSVFLNKGKIKCLEKLQNKFIKMRVGLRKCCHSTP